jgi:3D (Asp-Asp-Asp) domain-containing protein
MKKRINWAEILSALLLSIFIVGFWILAIWYTDSSWQEEQVAIDEKREQATQEEMKRDTVEATKTPQTATETTQALVSLGEYKITYYCPCEKCCGKSGGITASGTKAQANHTIAADWGILPQGTEVLINGQWYTVEDRGGAINGNRIDIFVESHEEAMQLGVDYYEVFKEGE